MTVSVNPKINPDPFALPFLTVIPNPCAVSDPAVRADPPAICPDLTTLSFLENAATALHQLCYLFGIRDSFDYRLSLYQLILKYYIPESFLTACF
ncbi:hypothetical protein TNCT_611731 [Trichonephila clavata]|uniref:Uncharacterized protein n=1 Tax=Trichonephila clavata TaxID=2740835 RepID=A0A8X6LSE3_TRICU|nr:hypothetical protein TNCT_611731 [Trichonephila clavata]